MARLICEKCKKVFFVPKDRIHNRQFCSTECGHRDPLRRFLKYVVRDDATGCWNWTGHSRSGGYGGFNIKDETALAHRASWILIRGKIPEGMDVLHRCIGNRKCVNPFHLYLGTDEENVRDRISQGRECHSVGERNHLAVLTEQQVLWIRSFPYVPGVYSRLARAVGVTPATIRKISTGKMWKHLPMPPNYRKSVDTA